MFSVKLRKLLVDRTGVDNQHLERHLPNSNQVRVLSLLVHNSLYVHQPSQSSNVNHLRALAFQSMSTIAIRQIRTTYAQMALYLTEGQRVNRRRLAFHLLLNSPLRSMSNSPQEQRQTVPLHRIPTSKLKWLLPPSLLLPHARRKFACQA